MGSLPTLNLICIAPACWPGAQTQHVEQALAPRQQGLRGQTPEPKQAPQVHPQRQRRCGSLRTAGHQRCWRLTPTLRQTLQQQQQRLLNPARMTSVGARRAARETDSSGSWIPDRTPHRHLPIRTQQPSSRAGGCTKRQRRERATVGDAIKKKHKTFTNTSPRDIHFGLVGPKLHEVTHCGAINKPVDCVLHTKGRVANVIKNAQPCRRCLTCLYTTRVWSRSKPSQS